LSRQRHVPVCFSIFLVAVKVVTVREEEVEGAEAREIDKLGPHSSSLPSPLRSVSTGQDINDEAQPVVSQVEGVTSIWPCSRIPRRLFCSVTASRGESDAPEKAKMNITDGLALAEAEIRTYSLMIVEI
jgi:hypothetical protein